MADVVLEYRREGTTSTGRIFWAEDNLPDVPLMSFEKVPFSVMMTHLARVVQKDTSCGVILVRSDSTNLKPFRLDSETVGLLRVDPVAVIRSMTFPPRQINVKRERAPVEGSPIRVGHDALADALGDQVYCRHSDSKIECPACGRWSAVENGLMVCREPACRMAIQAKIQSPRWATVATIDLLGSNFDRFYLPRTWNPNSIWVSKQELQDLFDLWTQEKVNSP